MTPYDMPAVRSVAREAERNDNRFSSLVVGVVKSVPFQMRTSPRENRGAQPKQESTQ